MTMHISNRGQVNVVGAIVGVAIATLVAVALLPAIQASINDANLTGATLTIANLVPLGIVLALMIIAFRVSGII